MPKASPDLRRWLLRDQLKAIPVSKEQRKHPRAKSDKRQSLKVSFDPGSGTAVEVAVALVDSNDEGIGAGRIQSAILPLNSLTKIANIAVIAVTGLSSLLCFGALLAAPSNDRGEFVYIGTYTDGKSKGIYGFRFQPAAGKLEALGLMAESVNPSFLAVHPNRQYLYAVNETESSLGRSISAFAIDRKTGKLTFLNRIPSRGGAPSDLVVDKTGKCLLVANYTSGSIAVFPLLEDGRLGEATTVIQQSGSRGNKQGQGAARPHSIQASVDNRFVVTADLGLDQLLVYRLDPKHATLSSNDPPFANVDPGSGPRHFRFHPSGRFAYVINELLSTITVFQYDALRGSLAAIQTVSTLPKSFSGKNAAAEIVVHPNGNFLYGSNRGDNSIAVFAIDRVQGTLTQVEIVPTGGKTPRNIAINPTGSYLFAANQDSDNVVIFRIGPNSGRLKLTGIIGEAPRPVCIEFVPAL